MCDVCVRASLRGVLEQNPVHLTSCLTLQNKQQRLVLSFCAGCCSRTLETQIQDSLAGNPLVWTPPCLIRLGKYEFTTVACGLAIQNVGTGEWCVCVLVCESVYASVCESECGIQNERGSCRVQLLFSCEQTDRHVYMYAERGKCVSV